MLPRERFTLLVIGAALFLPSFAAGWEGTPEPAKKEPKVRGMTVSCPTDGREWATDAMVDTMKVLQGLGVTWVCIHPYARIGRDGTVRGYSMRGADPTAHITRPIAEAHRLGLKIMIKPHLGYWGSFSWRGAIEFKTPEEWDRFFSGYTQWITSVAELSHGADAYVVGTELDRTLHFEDRWRAVIARVRGVYSGPLTYAANWSDYEKVGFWEDLDVIGIQAYFPVLETRAAGVPGVADLESGWARIMARVRAFSDRVGKRVVFTELGYNRSDKAPYEPWDYQVGGAQAEEIQRLCLDAALKVVEREPRVVGVFLWKWFPGERTPRNFAKSTPSMRAAISAVWRSGR